MIFIAAENADNWTNNVPRVTRSVIPYQLPDYYSGQSLVREKKWIFLEEGCYNVTDTLLTGRD